MKLFKTIALWDVYVAAETPEAAREAIMHWITEEKLKVSECTALEVRNDTNIRDSWKAQSPIVGNDISDDDFKKLKGKTTAQAFELLYKREAK